MGFKASQRRSVPLDAPGSQPSSGVVHSMSGFFSQTPYEPWCYTYCMPLSQFRSYTVISIASNAHTVWCGHCQEVKKGINIFSGIGVQERDCPRLPEGKAALAALPGVLCRGRSSVVVLVMQKGLQSLGDSRTIG
jgi:hypothetical protein